jgi:hypothetical protein
MIAGLIKEKSNNFTIDNILVDINAVKGLLLFRTNTDFPASVKAKASEEALRLTVETIRGVCFGFKAEA